MAQTLRDKLVTALINRGEKQIESRSSKYLTFTRKEGGYYFIGKSGACRIGPISSNSHPIHGHSYSVLIAEGTNV